MDFNDDSTESEFLDHEIEQYLNNLNVHQPNQNQIDNKERRSQKNEAAIQRRIERENNKKKQAGFEFYIEKFKPNIPERLLLLSKQDIKIDKFLKPQYYKEMLNFLQMKVYKNYGEFNEEELIALLSDKNFILLGRSGTGKTFVILNKLFLIHLSSCNKMIKSLHNIEKVTIRTVFTTSSDILIKSSRNYYKILDQKFKENKNVIKYDNTSHEALEKFFTEKENYDNYQTFYNITVKIYFFFLKNKYIIFLYRKTIIHCFYRFL